MGDLVVTKQRKVHLKSDDTCTDGDAEGMALSNKQDVAQTSLVDGSINGEESNIRSGSAKPYADDDTREVHIDRGSHNADSLQEFLQLANEYESVEASKRDSDNRCRPQSEGSYSPEGMVEQSIGLKEDKECVNNREAVLHSEMARSKSATSQEGVSVSKTAPMGDQRNLQNSNMGHAHASGNRRSSRSASFSSLTIGPSRSHFTIPQPFSLATDKRALGGGRLRDNGGGQVLQNALRFNGTFEDPHSKVPQVSRKLSASSPLAKLKSSEITKNFDDPLKRPTFRANPELPDEDAMSISSVRSCSQAPKAKTSRFTSTSSFNFPSDARAEKRKEFYLNLQERLKAKEEEMKQNQAKAKKEKEDEIKLLRKSMTFRASPVPSFYQEGPPPRAELAKAPTTRAKSPKFTRRDSHSGSGACTRLCNTVRCEAAEPRSSFSPQKPGKYYNREVLDKENQRRKSVGGRCVSESSIEQLEEGKMTSTGGTANALELLDDEISVTGGDFEDVHIKVRDPLTVSPELMMSDEEEEAPLQVQDAESKHATSHGEEDEVYVDKTSSCKGASNGSIGGQAPEESNALKGHDNMNAGVFSSNSNKKKVDRKMQQPFAYE